MAHKIITKVSAGGFHTLALCDDNELYAWGSGTYGECGYGEFLETNKPK
jgi:alpha-tubulin suppressor-like RCC1 family protein